MPMLTFQASTANVVEKAGIVPDVIDKFDAKTLLTVAYNQSTMVSMGNALTVEETQTEPDVMFTPLDDGSNADSALFTLVLTDPDAPSRQDPKISQYLHWIAVNIPQPPLIPDSNNFSALQGQRGNADTVVQYQGPAPPPGTGPHRYTFLLYQQSGKLDPTKVKPELEDERKKFDVRKWASQHSLSLVTANYFTAKKD